MDPSLDYLIKTLNPSRDFEDIDKINGLYSNNDIYTVNIHGLQYFARGLVWGGFLGATINFLTGDNPAEGLVTGTFLGSLTETFIFSVRYSHQDLKVTIERKKKKNKDSGWSR